MKAILVASSTTASSLSVCVSTTPRPTSSFTSSLSLFVPRQFTSLSSKVASPCTLPLHRCTAPAAPCARSSIATSMAAVASEPVDIIVKGATGAPEKLGDCPFCHRVLLTLEEKSIPYNLKLVDLSNKPDWFLEINPDGKVPVIKHEGNWVPDSDVITQIIEEKYPEPSHQTPVDKATVGSKIFSSFVKFLKSKDASDGSEEALVAELSTFNDYLKDNGPFIAGEKITGADLSLAPKLLHMKVALGHYKDWSILSELIHINKYMEALFSRPSFEKTKPESDELIIAGWKKLFS